MTTYDPNKTYSWSPETKFEISGQDFSLLLHAVRGVLSTKEATNTILCYEMNKKIEGILAMAVEDGRVVETEERSPIQMPVTDYEEVK